MAKAAYVGVGGTARAVKKIYVGAGGVAREVVKGYVGAGGLARQFYQREQGLQPVEFTVSGTSLKLLKGPEVGTSGNRSIDYSIDHGATWSSKKWLNVNLAFTGLSNHTLMLRGDLRCTDGNVGACAFYLEGTTTLTGVSGSFASILGGADGAIVDPAPCMFWRTFFGCSNLASITADLFKNIAGPPRQYMFYCLFENCTSLAAVPAGLFSGISGAPANGMFHSSFWDCDSLQTLPAGLFSGIGGPPAAEMFTYAFGADTPGTGLTAIPVGLFAGITGPNADAMFTCAFYNRSLLTGPSASTDAGKLYSVFKNATTAQVGDCYEGCTGLTDYNSIPANWK